jgi:putative tryptophan/tyrosine transport system substrate-binding protein
MPRMAMLSPGRSEPPDSTLNTVNAFLQGLHDLGYTNGQNIIIERKFANWNSERLRELAVELVKDKVDLIAALFTPAARAAKQATDSFQLSRSVWPTQSRTSWSPALHGRAAT